MLLKLSKYLVLSLIGGTTACSAACIDSWYENHNNFEDSYEDSTAATVCVPGQNDPQLCWNNNISQHIFTGSPATCYGTHASSAVEKAFNAGTISNPRVTSSNAATGLMTMQWVDGSGKQCQKTIWNDIQNYFRAPRGFPNYAARDIQNICIDTMTRTKCVTGSIVVADGYGGRICVQVAIGSLPNPGRSCYPRGIAPQSGAIGSTC